MASRMATEHPHIRQLVIIHINLMISVSIYNLMEVRNTFSGGSNFGKVLVLKSTLWSSFSVKKYTKTYQLKKQNKKKHTFVSFVEG